MTTSAASPAWGRIERGPATAFLLLHQPGKLEPTNVAQAAGPRLENRAFRLRRNNFYRPKAQTISGELRKTRRGIQIEVKTMGNVAKVLIKHLNQRPAPTLEEIQSKLENLNRVFSVFETPEYREYIAFAIAWQNLERELAALRATVRECLTERPINRVNEFLQKLKRTN